MPQEKAVFYRVKDLSVDLNEVVKKRAVTISYAPLSCVWLWSSPVVQNYYVYNAFQGTKNLRCTIARLCSL